MPGTICPGAGRPDGDGVVDAGDLLAECLGQPDTPSLEADQHHAGDKSIFLVTMITLGVILAMLLIVYRSIGTTILILLMVFDFTVHPPIWVHLVVTLPILVALCLGCLRPFKAWLVAEQYVHKAAPPEFSSNGKHGPF